VRFGSSFYFRKTQNLLRCHKKCRNSKKKPNCDICKSHIFTTYLLNEEMYSLINEREYLQHRKLKYCPAEFIKNIYKIDNISKLFLANISSNSNVKQKIASIIPITLN
jgi:hypothetical protein